jgi:hypothetical protein
MCESVKCGAIWRNPYLLSSNNQPTSIQNLRLSDNDHGAIDPKTYEAIEVDALFDTIDHTKTQIGQLTLFRSLSRPETDVELLKKKQDSLRELEANPVLYRSLQHYIENIASSEKSLYYLLYGEFAGGLSTDDEPKNDSNKLEFNGCGYRQFKDGTEFAVELVEAAITLPQTNTAYLSELLNTIREFSHSRIFKLIKGPIYYANGKFKTKQEKSAILPVFRFQPTMFKWLPIFFFMAAVGGILYFFQNFLPEIGASYIGYGILALTVPIFPVILHAMGVSDRDTIIYPLRKQFRRSQELARALEALGMIDELLSFRGYALSLDDMVTLPDLIDHKHHMPPSSSKPRPRSRRPPPCACAPRRAGASTPRRPAPSWPPGSAPAWCFG